MIALQNQTSVTRQGIIATGDELGFIHVYNHSNHRPENSFHVVNDKIAAVKIVKFLGDSDCLVSADMAGYLNFWAMNPHP
jgi:hypothetical protein